MTGPSSFLHGAYGRAMHENSYVYIYICIYVYQNLHIYVYKYVHISVYM